MKKGFTLVELSIVLVIIGLLIGGILAAQSMIKTVQINKIVSQISQYDVAISNFKTRYRQLPGDSTYFPTPGDNNTGITNSEVYRVWYHLSLGVGLKNKYGNDYGTFGNSTTINETQCPRFNIDQDTTQGLCLVLGNVAGVSTPIVYKYWEGAPANVALYAPLLPVDVAAIDKKLDDGLAASGNVYYSTSGGIGGNCASGNTYLVANSYSCIMFIAMNSTNGDTDRN